MNRKALEDAIWKLRKQINCFELNPDDYVDEFDDMLDSQGDVVIGGLRYSPSHVLKNIDETAYRCGLLDYVDGINTASHQDYIKLVEELENLESELEAQP